MNRSMQIRRSTKSLIGIYYLPYVLGEGRGKPGSLTDLETIPTLNSFSDY
jgi:hypothetical protein